jgi:hypothetical protein
LISTYLRDANPDGVEARLDGKAAVKERRAVAVRALHAIWLQWRAEAAAVTHSLPVGDYHDEALRQLHQHWIAELGAPHFFDDLMRVFFDRAGRVIFASPDPPTAMRDFWEGKPVRGRRAEDNAERNRKLTEAVQDRVDSGETNEKAIAAVAETAGMRCDTMHKIYYEKFLEVRAARQLRAMWNSEQ